MSAPVPATRPVVTPASGPVTAASLLRLIELDRWSFATSRPGCFGAWPNDSSPSVKVYYRTAVNASPQGPGRFLCVGYGNDCDVKFTIGANSVVVTLPAGSAGVASGTVDAPAVDAWYDLDVEITSVSGGAAFVGVYVGEDNLTTGDLP